MLGTLLGWTMAAYQLPGIDRPVGICEVGEKGVAPLFPPVDSEKATRYVPSDQEPVLGWRPAIDQIHSGNRMDAHGEGG